jgi:hypothetical protein
MACPRVSHWWAPAARGLPAAAGRPRAAPVNRVCRGSRIALARPSGRAGCVVATARRAIPANPLPGRVLPCGG